MHPVDRPEHWVSLGSRAWDIRTIWEAARAVPVEPVLVDDIREVDEDCWFHGGQATVRAVAAHARQIQDADLELPIIVAADGQVLDGMHRIAKAVLEGRDTVPAQRLPVDPEPDWLVDEPRQDPAS